MHTLPTLPSPPAAQPSQSSLRDARFPFLSPAVTSVPLFVTYGDISPRPGRICPGRGKSFLKGGALGSPHKVHLFAKASPFGRGGCERSERTEKARPFPAARMFPQETSAANAAFLHDSTRENAMPDSPQAVRHCSYKNKNSAVYGQSKAEAI